MAEFTEQSLRQAIINTWGPAGAHLDVFDSVVKQRDVLRTSNGLLNRKLRHAESVLSELAQELDFVTTQEWEH